MIKRISLILLGIMGVGAPARADLALFCSCRSSSDVNLYWVDGDRVFSAVCNPGTTLYSRDNCQNRPREATLELFLGAFNYQYEYYVVDAEHRQDEAYVRLQQVEARIDQLLAGEIPDVPTTDVEEELARAEATRAEILVVITDTKDQMARVEAELARNPSSDLAEQLALLGERLAAKQGEIADQDSVINGLRQQVLAAYAVLAQRNDFVELTNMRNEIVRRYTGATAAKKEFLQHWAFARNELRKVFDQFFVWEIMGYSRSSSQQSRFAGEVEGSFDQAVDLSQ